ncbi:MAG TPA: HYR domain-containing protein [Chryseosolibacter sp.]|nr:HYR domain-containing protein [Chryseosolibacter sp.]
MENVTAVVHGRLVGLTLMCLILSAITTNSFGQCCPATSSCSPCSGGIRQITFRYDGTGSPLVSVSSGAAPVLVHFSGTVSAGETFVVSSTLTTFFTGQLRITKDLVAAGSTNAGCPFLSIGDYVAGEFKIMEAITGTDTPTAMCCTAGGNVESTPPTFATFPSDTTVSANNACKAVVNWDAPTATDNCSTPPVITSDIAPGSEFALGITTVTYTASDYAGNETVQSFTVTVVDDTGPQLSSCPSNITVSADASCEATATWTPPTAQDNCIVNLSTTHNPGSVFPLGVTTVTYTATDIGGNTATCSFDVTVEDVTIPVISGCPSAIQVSTGGACSASVSWTPPSASDNCDAPVTLTSNYQPGDEFPIGTTAVTYTATDTAGNTQTCTFDVTVIDETPPVISGCPSPITVSVGSGCAAVVNWDPPSATDNCDQPVTITGTHAPGNEFQAGITTVTYTATDSAGNLSECSFTVTVDENSVPQFAGCPSPMTLTADADCLATATWTPPVASDNCDSPVNVTSTHNPGDEFPLGTTTVTYTASDTAGNVAVCSFDITVEDVSPPVISGCPAAIEVSADGHCTATVSWPEPSASDNCDAPVTLTSNFQPGDDFPIGTTLVIYIASDSAGNTDTCSFQITVIDATPPSIAECPSAITVSAGAQCTAMVTWTPPSASDNCDQPVAISGTHAPGDEFPVGITTVTYTATDSAGNVSQCSFTITVEENSPPQFAGCPSPITLNADEDCFAAATWTPPIASDNCDSPVNVTSTHNPGDEFPVGTTTVKYIATDSAGNVAECSFGVTVNEPIPPVISNCPATITVDAGSACTAVVTWNPPTASDNCTADVVISSNFNPGDEFSSGTTTVIYTATDDAGNTSTCSFDVVVRDNTPPQFSNCPASITAEADSACTAVVSWEVPVASDNCSAEVDLQGSHAPGDEFPMGVTTVTYIATDSAGNEAQCTFTVTVTDTTPPVFSLCPAPMTVSANDQCVATAVWQVPLASDNCSSGLDLTSTHNPGDEFPLGITTVTYTATDSAGNMSECSFTVTVADTTAPEISGCPEAIVIPADDRCVGVASWDEPVATDKCSSEVGLSGNYAPGDEFPVGVTTVTYTATDSAGNVSECSFTVTVTDVTAPVITGCPSPIVAFANDECTAVVFWEPPRAEDNCTANPTLTGSHNPGDEFPIGVTVVSYTATDSAGNSTGCSFTITVHDTLAPAFTGCPGTLTLDAGEGCAAVATWTPPQATDNCDDSVEVTSNFEPGDEFPVGSTLVVYSAVDSAGNTDICSFEIVVKDITAPELTGCPASVSVNADSTCSAVVRWDEPEATDNCSQTVAIGSNMRPGDVFPIGTTLVEYTATDDAGNESTCSFTVIVNDTAPPELTDCPADIIEQADTLCARAINWDPPIALNDCDEAVSMTSNFEPGDSFSVGTTTVNYVATDDAGNVTGCSFDITVQDNNAPVITKCPADLTRTAGNSCTASVQWQEPAFADDCSYVVESNYKPGDEFPLGITTVTYTARDLSGNTATCSFDVNVVDSTPPVISACPLPVTVDVGDACSATVSWDPPTASDNCGMTLTSNYQPGDSFPVGKTTVKYDATDEAGNTASCSFDVVVRDKTTPQIIGCPQSVTAEADATCAARVSWTVPSTQDNCEVTLTSDYKPGDEFPIGVTKVTYTATDKGGNTATCSFDIKVVDRTPPQITNCPANILASANGSCDAVVTWTEPTASDNCSVALSRSHASGDMFPIGQTEVTYTATDDAGLTVTCSFVVTVKDDEPPSFENCPVEIVAYAGASCESVVSWDAPVTSDNCGIATLTSSHQPGDVFAMGITQVEYKAIDVYGNESLCSFKVIVRNDDEPVVTGCPVDIFAKAGESGEVNVQWEEPVFTVRCGSVSVDASHRPNDVFAVGTTTVVYTATDDAGDVATCTFNVNVSYEDFVFDIGKVVTPDGDGTNDLWELGNIEKFQNNKVTIFDRWGTVVYSAAGYNNDNIAWHGAYNNGVLVPTGTYFYVITVHFRSQTIEKRGFIEIIR